MIPDSFRYVIGQIVENHDSPNFSTVAVYLFDALSEQDKKFVSDLIYMIQYYHVLVTNLSARIQSIETMSTSTSDSSDTDINNCEYEATHYLYRNRELFIKRFIDTLKLLGFWCSDENANQSYRQLIKHVKTNNIYNTVSKDQLEVLSYMQMAANFFINRW
jgi:hypothetical protein